VLVTGLVAVFTIDIVRLRSKAFATLYERHLGALMRESEKTQINGVIWYLVGVIFTLAAYPRDVAVVAILTLSWSDTTASTIGRLWGRYTAPLPDHLWGVPALKFAKRKSLAGFLAAVATGFAIGVGFYGLSAAGDKAYATWAVLHGKHTVWGVLGTSAVIGVGGAVVEALGTS
jgi:diacylglycerol kinase (CTP)